MKEASQIHCEYMNTMYMYICIYHAIQFLNVAYNAQFVCLDAQFSVRAMLFFKCSSFYTMPIAALEYWQTKVQV